MSDRGKLLGIARHGRPRGPMETLDRIHVSIQRGLDGDFRGAVKPGGKGRRQVSLIRAEDWAVAMAELGADVPWWERRANLLVEGVELENREGAIISIGADVRIAITQECDPCSRMEEVAPGLKAVLMPHWRAGALGKVITGGDIRIGDEIVIGDA